MPERRVERVTVGPKSQVLVVCAWAIWACALLGIEAGPGWALRSEGPPLAILATLGLALYLTSGVRLVLDPVRGEVRVRRRILGVPVFGRTRPVELDVIELRASWMGSTTRSRSLVYDLFAMGIIHNS